MVDGAPSLNKADPELWPDSDRQRRTVHRLRNVIAKLPKRQDLHNRIRDASWAALDHCSRRAEKRLGFYSSRGPRPAASPPQVMGPLKL